MESPQYAPPPTHVFYHAHYNNTNSNSNTNAAAAAADAAASRPSLGFPLGTALLLVVIFSLSGIFSCCYHWDKFRALRGAYADDDGDLEAPSDEKPHNSEVKRQEIIESVPVIMPGDQIPTFIALPCPCAPPRGPDDDLSASASVTTVQAADRKPPKPPRFLVPAD